MKVLFVANFSPIEPWQQTIARLLSPEGLIVGVCHTPWLHPTA